MVKKSITITLFLGVLFMLWSTTAMAATESPVKSQQEILEEAKAHFMAGNALIQTEDFEGAATEFEISYRLNPNKSALFNLAYCYKANHQYGRSVEAFEQLLAKYDGELTKDMRKAAKDTLKQLQGLVAKVNFAVDQPGAMVMINGDREVQVTSQKPVLLGPGKHEIEVSLEGFEKETMDVHLVAREDKTLVITLKPKNDQKHFAQETESKKSGGLKLKPWEWGLIGGTVLAGIGTGVFWGLWSGADGDYDDFQADLDLLTEGTPEWDDTKAERNDAGQKATRMGNVATGFTVATAVMLAGTTAALILDLAVFGKKNPEDPNVAFYPGGVFVNF